MGFEGLAEAVEQRTERRRLLSRAGAATLALAAGVLGRSESASALYPYHGCNLCHTPNSQGGPACPNLRCSWCWIGECHGETGNRHKNLCCEGYGASGGTCCSPGCTGVACSFLGPYALSCTESGTNC